MGLNQIVFFVKISLQMVLISSSLSPPSAGTFTHPAHTLQIQEPPALAAPPH